MPAKPPDPYPATVDLPLQTRTDVRLMPESVDAERRTVEVVWSTGAAVRRRDPWTGKRYDEVFVPRRGARRPQPPERRRAASQHPRRPRNCAT